MSYRAFKRLLGETSLERKCRFLFGGFIFLLITGSFGWYARQTEHLAYDQIQTTCKLLVNHIVARQIATRCVPGGEPMDEPRKNALDKRQRTMNDFSRHWEQTWPQGLKEYGFSFFTPNATRRENRPDSEYAQERLKEFLADPARNEDSQLLLASNEYHYYGAIRATTSCLECHRKDNPELKEQGLIAMVQIKVPTRLIEDGVHVNRAILLSTALGTALLIMGGSYLIVRYVVVKPVKHLKEVSDAISAGELNVRSEIQTGDEFEDLSHAFNRMLRNLVAMQDRLRKVNADLDRKVDELAQANLALYESNQLKSDFLATMSHELRTPLNSILGFSDVLLSGDQLNDKQQRWVKNIKTSGERLLALINDILELAKIEAGKMQVRIGEFSIYDICEGMLTMFRPLAEKKNIDLRGQLDPGIPLLQQDAGKVQQILANLLSNAVKFTPEGGRVLLRAIPVQPPRLGSDPGPASPFRLPGTFDREPPAALVAGVPATEGFRLPGTFDREPLAPHELLLIVTDTGVGITPEEQELVFEKFRQGANPLTREHTGTGLGLSIVRELSRLLGGEVTLQSELGRGSTFTVRLPVCLSAEPRLEFDLAHESVDLSKAQRIDARVYAAPQTAEGI
jgi:two-component system, NarL family, sensor histidine kinase BarA